jgi:hypothetical protein
MPETDVGPLSRHTRHEARFRFRSDVRELKPAYLLCRYSASPRDCSCG